MARPLGLLLEYVCDAHVTRDPVGPFITRLDGAWAYCAGHGIRDHEWRRITPTPRPLLDQLDANVELLCATPHHLERGLEIPDGHGILTMSDRKWAYCSAALDEHHDWRPVVPLSFREIEHDRIGGLIEAPQ